MMVIRTSVSISIKVIFLCCISMNYGLTHSMNKIMKKKNEVVFSFAVFSLENGSGHNSWRYSTKRLLLWIWRQTSLLPSSLLCDNNNNDDWRVWGETDNNKDHFYNGDHHGY